MLGQNPKDFDIATNAHPNEIRKLFKNCRLIGRRFRLAHILFHREIIEVATFRKECNKGVNQKKNADGMIVRDNVYGRLDDDVWRRDLTINALYYNIADFSIIDYAGGYKDIKNKLIRIIGSPTERYQEDPVRMLRAIRFAAKLNFSIEEETSNAIHHCKDLLTNVSNSRLFDEVTKLYHCGNSIKVQELLIDYGLFGLLFPLPNSVMQNEENVSSLIHYTLENTDNRIQSKRPVTPAFFYAVILWYPLRQKSAEYENQGHPPLTALEMAMSSILSIQCKQTSIPKRLSQSIREMWLLQYRLPKRYGFRALKTLEHPRFRAAYDFLLLRTLVGEESVELADWWTAFQEADTDNRRAMIKKVSAPKRKKRK